MFSFVRHSDRSKFSERTTCLHIRGLSIAVFMCTICTRVQIFTREQIYTRVQICTPLCRVHMPINCAHTHQDLIRNLTQGTHFMRNSLSLNVLNDNIFVLSRCMCVRERGGVLVISTAECVVETFTIHSSKGQVRKAYSLHDKDILFV